MTSRRRQRRGPPKGLIWLHTCACEHCKGRAAVCTAGFDWLDRRAPDHAQHHAQEDLLVYFDRLPIEIQDALNRSDTNVDNLPALVRRAVDATGYPPSLAMRLVRKHWEEEAARRIWERLGDEVSRITWEEHDL
jgi:hypothetical protein